MASAVHMPRRFARVPVGMALATLFAAARAAAEGGSAEPPELRPGGSIEWEIARGEEHQYRLPLPSDTFVNIEVAEVRDEARRHMQQGSAESLRTALALMQALDLYHKAEMPSLKGH